jgi:hypothetical protein
MEKKKRVVHWHHRAHQSISERETMHKSYITVHGLFGSMMLST